MANDGHEVTFLVGGYPGCAPEEMRDGFRIIRVGNRVTVYWQAYQYYKKRFKDWPDLIIEEITKVQNQSISSLWSNWLPCAA